MTKTLFISDLDGTLLNGNKQVPLRSVQEINKLMAKGLQFSIATARTPATVQELLKDIEIQLPIVLMNGAALYDLHKKCYLDVAYIGEALVSKMECSLGDLMHQCFVYTISNHDLEVYYNCEFNAYQKEFYEERKDKAYKRFAKGVVPNKAQIAYFVFMDTKEAIQKIYDKIKDFEELAISMYRDIYTEDGYLLEVYSCEATKANGIKKLKKDYGLEEVICFGDNLNDLSMFEVANKGIAVANAANELKALAYEIIGSNEEEAVVQYMVKYYKEKGEDRC